MMYIYFFVEHHRLKYHVIRFDANYDNKLKTKANIQSLTKKKIRITHQSYADLSIYTFQ